MESPITKTRGRKPKNDYSKLEIGGHMRIKCSTTVLVLAAAKRQCPTFKFKCATEVKTNSIIITRVG